MVNELAPFPYHQSLVQTGSTLSPSFRPLYTWQFLPLYNAWQQRQNQKHHRSYREGLPVELATSSSVPY